MCLAHRRGCCECRRELQMRESGVRAVSEGPRLHTQGRGRRGGGSDGSGGGGDGEAGSEGIRGAGTACAKNLGGVKRRKLSCRPLRGAKYCIQGRRDRQRVEFEWLRPRASAASPGMETVGYTEPCWVGGSKAVGNGRARLRVARNFARVAAGVWNASRLRR